MITVNARSTSGPTEPFRATAIERNDPGPRDIVIDIAYAGVCHSDIDHARSLRGHTRYPVVPGHEIAGIVSAVGSAVTKFAVGDAAGVGNTIWACQQCPACKAGQEQFCTGGRVLTYNSIGRDGKTTYGGYSQKIVVDEAFAVRIPANMPLQNAAPMFCAGITMYSPMRRWNVGPGKRVGIVGFGGLGHVGVQISRAFGAHTTVLDLSPAKRDDALRLGANEYRLASDPATFKDLDSSLDLIISSVPANIDLDAHLRLLTIDGALVHLPSLSEPLKISTAALSTNRRSIVGARSGGMGETQEMIDFCAKHDIAAEVEVIGADQIDLAFERMLAGDVKFRFVIDIATMADR